MKVALLGNPNTGKSSIFNLLTGLRQEIGNFPGVTVECKVGTLQIREESFTITDFPGTYSLYPHSKEEELIYDVLSDANHDSFPDIALVVADASNLKRNLFLFSQIYDLEIPCVLVLNMSDLAHRNGITIDIEALNAAFPNATIVTSNARAGLGKDRIIEQLNAVRIKSTSEFIPFLEKASLLPKSDFSKHEIEAEMRYKKLNSCLNKVVSQKSTEKLDNHTSRIDKILVHPIFGYLIFMLVLLVIFQFIFSFASYPMDAIENSFIYLSETLNQLLPAGIFTDLICQGILPGIGGVVIFIPQIAILFFFISILEESGYLARVVFIMDRLMRPFGLNGKSVVPLISSVACAIPGVMAARTISDWKERIITIFVAPLMSCSARIPVYTLLIALVIPKETVLGIFNLQGLVLFGLYFLGIVSALTVAIILKLIIRSKDKGFLLLELPSYKIPRWGNVGISVLDKVRVFIVDAGKIIIAISIILWALATYGPNDYMQAESKKAYDLAEKQGLSPEDKASIVASVKLENSYIGIMGKAIEPVIKPLGYDWKMGISLITSFAAREVFVGSLSTIYAVHNEEENNKTLLEKLRADKNEMGKPTYTFASGMSLMIFYVFAMQCMATLAVVKRETNSWKWAIIQLITFGAMAYLAAFITFQLLN